MDRVVLISGSSNEPLAKSISSHLNIPLTPTNFSPYPSGESRVEILSSVRNRTVYLIQSGYTHEPTSPSPNDHIMQTVMLADACHHASAREIVLVMPCLPYAEEPEDVDDIDPEEIECETELQTFMKESIFPSAFIPLPQPEFYYDLKRQQSILKSQSPPATDPLPIFTHPDPFKLIASLLQCSGANHLLTLHLPRPQLVGYFDIPVDDLSIIPILHNKFDKYTFSTTDISMAKQASQIARSLQRPFTLLHRLSPQKDFNINREEVVDKHILLVDEMDDRLFQAVKELKSFSVASVSLLFIHLLLKDPQKDLKRLESTTEFDRIFITNSIRIPESLKSCDHIEIIDISAYLAKAIECLQLGNSLKQIQIK